MKPLKSVTQYFEVKFKVFLSRTTYIAETVFFDWDSYLKIFPLPGIEAQKVEKQ